MAAADPLPAFVDDDRLLGRPFIQNTTASAATRQTPTKATRLLLMRGVNHYSRAVIPYNSFVKSFVVVAVLATACTAQKPFRLTAPERYEVGQEATLTIDAANTPVEADLVVERPDGTSARQPAQLTHATSRIKLGEGFTQTGRYRVTLVQEGKPLAPPLDINITIDRLSELLAEAIGDYKAKHRGAKSRAAGSLRWMQYSGVYEHPWQADHDIEVTIEEPREAMKRAWAVYAEQGVVQVIQNNYVRLREGAETTMAAWTSRGLIIAIRAADLTQMDPKFLARFFAKHPSDLQP
jgi:hypothetical protein